MFFKRVVSSSTQKPVPAVGWDEKTCAHFAGSELFSVSITSITKRFGYGAHQHGISERLGYEVSGIITYPKYIQVMLEICKPEWKEFGSWRYDTLDPSSQFPRPEFPFPIPHLLLWVNDPQNEVAEARKRASGSAKVMA